MRCSLITASSVWLLPTWVSDTHWGTVCTFCVLRVCTFSAPLFWYVRRVVPVWLVSDACLCEGRSQSTHSQGQRLCVKVEILISKVPTYHKYTHTQPHTHTHTH